MGFFSSDSPGRTVPQTDIYVMGMPSETCLTVDRPFSTVAKMLQENEVLVIDDYAIPRSAILYVEPTPE